MISCLFHLSHSFQLDEKKNALQTLRACVIAHDSLFSFLVSDRDVSNHHIKSLFKLVILRLCIRWGSAIWFRTYGFKISFICLSIHFVFFSLKESITWHQFLDQVWSIQSFGYKLKKLLAEVSIDHLSICCLLLMQDDFIICLKE